MQALLRAQQTAADTKKAADAAAGQPDEVGKKAAAHTAAQDLQTAVGVAQTSGSAVLGKVNTALSKFGDLYTAMAGVPVSQAVTDGVASAFQSLTDAKGVLQDTSDDFGKVVSKATEVVSTILMDAVLFGNDTVMSIAETLEFLAAGDIILPEVVPSKCVNGTKPAKSVCPKGKSTIADCPAPPGQCYQSADSAGFPSGKVIDDPDPIYRRNVQSRGTPTHEYGHYTLCNLLAQSYGDKAFRSAYSEAAIAGILHSDDASVQPLYINDGFADFFASEVVGGTSYPNLAFSIPNSPKSGMTYCTNGTAYVSDLAWVSSTNGFGPAEKDMSNGQAGAGDGTTITLNGTTYAKGIGVHANSEIIVDIIDGATTFTADIGVDDEVGNSGSVIFEVYADGTKLYGSPTMTGTTATEHVSVNLTGKSQLRLVVTDAGDGNTSDHADWANAQLALGNGGSEDNIGAPGSTYLYNPASPSYEDEVARILTTLHDVFDRSGFVLLDPNKSYPAQVTAWSHVAPDTIAFSSTYEGNQDDEAVSLNGGGWFAIVANMLDLATPHITQDNLMKGINATMIGANYNWCQRCEVFSRHTPSATCPSSWMDARPDGMVCDWEGCVPPTVPDHDQRICVPPPPTCPIGYHYDPVAKMCVINPA